MIFKILWLHKSSTQFCSIKRNHSFLFLIKGFSSIVYHLICSEVTKHKKSGCQEIAEDLDWGAFVFLLCRFSEHTTTTSRWWLSLFVVVSVLLTGSPSWRISVDRRARCCEVRELIFIFFVRDTFSSRLHSFSNLKIKNESLRKHF